MCASSLQSVIIVLVAGRSYLLVVSHLWPVFEVAREMQQSLRQGTEWREVDGDERTHQKHCFDSVASYYAKRSNLR